MLDELQDVQHQLEQARVSVALIRSAVPGFFVAGADLKLLGKADTRSFEDYLDMVRATIEGFATARYLTIAAIDGHALGGGLELALACSLRVAGPKARVGLPEIKLGIIPGAGGTQRLARLLPPGGALELLLTGRSADAGEAYRLRIVDRLAPAESSGEEAGLELARELARGPLDALRSIVDCVNAAREGDFDRGMAFERAEVVRLFESEDCREGVAAFLEKRPPSFGS